MDDIALVGRFKQYQMDERTATRARAMRADALRLAQKLNESAKDSREKSEALTHLEDFVMWATRATAMNPAR